MNGKLYKSVKLCLKRDITKLSIQLFFARLSRLLFIMYAFFSFYFLIFDVSFIEGIGLYENEFAAFGAAFISVAVGTVLFFLSLWLNFTIKLKIESSCDNIGVLQFNTAAAIKLAMLKAVIFLRSSAVFAVNLMPSVLAFTILLYLLKSGISRNIFALLISCSCLLFLSGFIASFCLVQKYSLCLKIFSENSKKTFYEIFKISEYLTNGRLKKTAVTKLIRFPLFLLGIILPNIAVAETALYYFIMTDKIIPHMQRSANAEKPVVFYFGRV